MISWIRERLLPVLALCAAGALVPLATLHFMGREEVQVGTYVHFAGVGASAFAAMAAAIALTIVGARRGDARTVLVGTAFSAMAALLSLHGLATPGVLADANGVVSLSGAATLPLGGAVLALSAVPGLRAPDGVRSLLALQGLLLGVILALGVVGLLSPATVPDVPDAGSALALGLLAIGLAFFLLLELQAARTFLLTRRRGDFIVVFGIALLAAALPAALVLNYRQLGWWLGHGFELLGIVLVGAPVALDLRRGTQSRPISGGMRAGELVSAEEIFLGARVRALTARLAEKDEYTEGHTRRVARRAVEVGEELGLSASRLRTLATGGLLHDIGKLSVPDAILKKPGSLDKEEFNVIRRHPEWGHRLLGELGGFSDSVRRLVLDHHERLDGSGYPRGLDTDLLDLETRILAVCDVYDALISTRVYRAAWSHERAMGLILDRSGVEFDPGCVDALVRVLAREGLFAHPVAV
jgi:HD-GYP domain-containing protein (c-di-GMP phosphodiesterase class II)